jgi:hypothetical protein
VKTNENESFGISFLNENIFIYAWNKGSVKMKMCMILKKEGHIVFSVAKSV